MHKELYEMFKSIGADDEKAKAAAIAVADYIEYRCRSHEAKEVHGSHVNLETEDAFIIRKFLMIKKFIRDCF